MSIDHCREVQEGRIDVEEFISDVLEKTKQINKEHNFFTVISTKEAKKQAKELQQNKDKGLLAGLPISIKDCVTVKGVESTAGSRILKGYKPLFDATVVKKLKQAGAIIIGKTSQDAFGFGSFNVNVGLDYEIPTNPHDKERTTGGSSGGAAGITALADFPHVAIAESTGGSIEAPAAFCGVIGFCPTYGAVSRNGLISYANSLDKIGIMATKVDHITPVFKVIAGHDPKDATSLTQELDLHTDSTPLKVAVIEESMGEGVHKEVKEKVRHIINQLTDKEIKVDTVSLPITFKYGIPTYYIISTSESSTNLSCLSGLRYGQEDSVKGKGFNEYFKQIRSEHFNEESKRRIMLGTFTRMAGYRDAYYIKATKIRTLIIQEYKKLFEDYDILISPTMPMIAPKLSKIKEMTPLQNYMSDILTVGPNLAGIPHASMPIGTSNDMPVGLMVMANHLEEGKLLQFMKLVEDLA